MLQETVGGAVGHRPAGRAAPAAHAHQALFEQDVERAAAGLNAAHRLDVGAGHGLVIGDDGQGLLRGARQPARVLALQGHQEGEIGGGLEPPASGDLRQLHPTSRIAAPEGGEARGDVGVRRQPRGEIGRPERLGGGEQQGLDHAFDGGRVVHAAALHARR